MTDAPYRPILERQADGLVYVIQMGGDDGPVKIGISRSPRSRLAALAGASPVPLRLITVFPGCRSDEAALHRRFKHYRLNGEWFLYTDEVRKWVRSFHGDPQGNALAPERNVKRRASSRKGWRTRKIMDLCRWGQE